MLKNRKRKGQSTLEYIILITAVVAVLILFLSDGGIFRTRVNQTLDSVSNGMTDMANRVSTSRPLSPSTSGQ